MNGRTERQTCGNGERYFFT